MFDGPSVSAALKSCGITHVVWLPDSELGRWESALAGDPELCLIRVCREGEAFAIAAGLHLGGCRPIILLQCTGLFEAGDALRNVLHDLRIPLFVLVGVRSWLAHRKGQSRDTCPVYIEPIMQAWGLPYVWLDERHSPKDLAAAYQLARNENRAGAALLAE